MRHEFILRRAVAQNLLSFLIKSKWKSKFVTKAFANAEHIKGICSRSGTMKTRVGKKEKIVKTPSYSSWVIIHS